MTDKELYRSNVAWRTVIKNVQMVAERTWILNVYPEDDNDLGAGIKQVGYFLCDNVGSIYRLTEINVGGDVTKVKAYDSLEYDECPQNFKPGIVFKSQGNAPYLSPAFFPFLDNSAYQNMTLNMSVLWNTREAVAFTDVIGPILPVDYPTHTYQQLYAEKYGEHPDFQLIITADANTEWIQLATPTRYLVDGKLDHILYDLPEGLPISGKIIISR